MNTPLQRLSLLASVFALCVTMTLAGCSLGTTARNKSAESIALSHDTTVNRSLRGDMVPSVTVSGTNNSVRVGSFPLESSIEVADKANTKGTAEASLSRSFTASVSTWLALAAAFAALGFAILAYVLFSKLTAAGKATDVAMSAAIDLAGHGLPKDKLLAGLEKLRGKVSRRS